MNRVALESVVALAVEEALDDIFPAAAIAVIHQGTLVLEGAWGYIDPETQLHPVTTETYFDLASVTKLFTVTAFLSLAGEHRLSLDAPLVEIVPEFGRVSPRPIDGGQDPHTKAHLPVPEALSGKWINPHEVTFRQLLTHTSGLPPWRDVYTVAPPPAPPPERPEAPDSFPRLERWQRALARLCDYPFVGSPGDCVRYSDIGLMLLGEVVSRLYGTPGDLCPTIQSRVLVPAGLHDVVFNPVRDHNIALARIAPTEFDPTWRGRRVWGEVHDENACGVGGVAGHAGLFATARDVAQFGQAWLAASVDTFAILPELAREAVIEQTRSERRGLGWVLKSATDSSAGDLFDESAYGHTGFTGTSLWIDPARALVVALLTNRVYPGRDKPGIHAFRRRMHDLLARWASG